MYYQYKAFYTVVQSYIIKYMVFKIIIIRVRTLLIENLILTHYKYKNVIYIHSIIYYYISKNIYLNHSLS